MKKEQLLSEIKEKRIIAIARGVSPDVIADVAKALHKGGIHLLEITFDQSKEEGIQETKTAIKNVKKELGDQMRIGAGTVLTKEQVDVACEAGAEFILAPSVDPDVIRYAAEKGLLTMPGAMTPTEMECANKAGADIVKIFPAADLASDYIKSVKAPLSHILFSAVGGVNLENLQMFLQAGCVCVGIGGNLVDKKLIAAGAFDEITRIAGMYTELV